MTTFLSVKDRAVGNLAGELTSGASSLTLQSGQGASFPDPDSGDEDFIFTIEDEHLLCTARTGDVLTVTRAQEGTADVTHAGGVAAELRVVASQFSAIHAAVNTLEGQVGNVDMLLVYPAGMNAFTATASGVSALTDSVGLIGRFSVRERVVFRYWSYYVNGAGSANAVVRGAVYSGDGQTKHMDDTHAVGASTGVQTVDLGGGNEVTLEPGDYYFFICLSTGTTGPVVNVWDTSTLDLINQNVPGGQPVLEGTVSVTSGAAPATVDTDADISGSLKKTLFARLDT